MPAFYTQQGSCTNQHIQVCFAVATIITNILLKIVF